MTDPTQVARRLRHGLLWLAGLGVAGTAIELATLRHWKSFDQLVPWMILVVLAAGVAAMTRTPTRGRVRAVQALSALAAIGGLYGVVEHIRANYQAAILDYRYTDRWLTMSMLAKLWAAASGAVGPSPTLAPAIFLQTAACLWLAFMAPGGAALVG